MSDFSGWDPKQEDWAAIESLPTGVPFGNDYRGIPRAVKPPREWLRIERQVRNDCQGNSLSSGVEVCRYYATGEIVQLSRHFAYIATQSYQGGGNWGGRIADQGSTIAGGVRLAKEVGICLESECPYPSRFRTDITESQKKSAAPYKIEQSRRLTSPLEVRQWIESGMGAVHAGVRWGSGYHAIEYLSIGKNGTFDFANSWGESWDGDGWGEDTERELAARFRDQWAVFIGISGQANAEPPEFDWINNTDWSMA